MNLVRAVRSRLGWKLFLTYLIVVGVGVLVLMSASALSIPSSFDRHMLGMRETMPGMMPGMRPGPVRDPDLFSGFRAAAFEATLLAAGAATLAAVVLSLLVARRVVEPVRRLVAATRRIDDGHYDERVELGTPPTADEMDELDQLAVSFNQMASRLDRTESLRRQLIGDVSHELRTPLTAIQASIEGLRDGVLQPDQATLTQIHREAGRLQRLVDDLQELSRVEAGAYELRRRPLDVERLLRAAAARLERQYEDKGVALSIEVEPGLPAVAGDEDRLGQVLLNLIGNALHYTPAGRSVRLRAWRAGGEVRIEVQDQGIGIAAEHLPHVFDRFYRVDRSRSRPGGGSGIGLTIARHLVEAHGGRIWAASDGADRGSTFTFTLPVDAGPPDRPAGGSP